MQNFIILLLILPFMAQAQSVGVKDIPVSSEGTTIEIKKGSSNKPTDRDFEIVTDEDSIEGDGAPLLKEARSNWKVACADWKKELKELNKDNQLLSISCGTMKCTTEAMESTCRSQARYKVKVRLK